MQLHQLVLDAVRVLVLVDEDVAQARAPRLAHLGVVAQQAQRQDDQVVEVDRPVRGEALLVALHHAHGDDGSAALRPPCSPARTSASAAADARPRFFQPPIAHCQRRASALSVVAPASFSTPSTSSLSRMLKFGFRPSALPSLPQHAHAERMEGADRELRRGAAADQRARPLAHLGRGLVGEGDRRDLRGRIAGLEQARDLVDDDARLPEPAPASTRHGPPR